MAKEVIVYSSNTCPHCTTAKEYLAERGISYIEKNVSTDPAAKKELIKKGFMGVPVIIVGDQTITGFDKEKLDELL
ncbi:glutaredoxin family protein [Clostridiaceae bacterium M8S5]|nr:glutaredoxin family protein [Clostridiaceae bacterium M8S5]